MFPPVDSAIGSSAPPRQELFPNRTVAPIHLTSDLSFSHTPPTSENVQQHATDHLPDPVSSLITKCLTAGRARIPASSSSNRERLYRIQ